MNGASNVRSSRLAIGARFSRDPIGYRHGARGKKSLKDSDSDVLFVEEEDMSLLARSILGPSIVLAVVGCIAAYFLFPKALEWLPDLSHRPEYVLKPDDIRFTDAPLGAANFLAASGPRRRPARRPVDARREARRQRGGRVPESIRGSIASSACRRNSRTA